MEGSEMIFTHEGAWCFGDTQGAEGRKSELTKEGSQKNVRFREMT